MGRNLSLLERDPELAKAFVDAYVAGMSGPELAREFNVDRSTIYNWLKSPSLQGEISRAMTERVNRLTRKLDAEIENRVNSPHFKHMDLDDLLKLRKEILGPATQRVQVEQNTKVNVEGLSMDLWSALDNDPEASAALSRVIGGTPAGMIEESVTDADVVSEGESNEDDDDAVPALGADLAQG